ncbi:glycoside hydrolase family 18 protein [Rhodotorula paludigena]|uniref:glycoside hydrolase family 18 protein n=1 Tax=Rhodotorula paludigena TaxID=86838 RepID=UPI00316C9D68
MLFTSPFRAASRPTTLLPFVLLAALALFAQTVSALPTARAPSPYEPFFRRASPQVGPNGSVERLRLRRSLNDNFHGRRNSEVANLKRELPGPIGSVEASAVVIVNPKAKRANVPSTRTLERRALGLPAFVPNPKTKRSYAPVANPKAKRDAVPTPSASAQVLRRRAAGLPAVASNPKKRWLDLKKRAVVGASISVTPSQKKVAKRSLLDRVKRFLAGVQPIVAPSDLTRRAESDATFTNSTARIGTVRIIPNPKSPSFSGGASTSSTVPSATTTTSSAAPTATQVTCALTADCSNAGPIPDYANRYCNSGVCSWRCRSGFTNTGTGCTLTSAAPTSSSVLTTSAASTRSITSTATTTTTSSAPSATATSHGMLAAGYYPYWVEDTMPPEDVDWSLYDIINYSFALPTSDYSVDIPDWVVGNLQRTVRLAHAVGTKVVIAVGGWSDSVYFSGAVSTASRRQRFVQAIVDMVNQYDLDGVDIDWEYPGTNGAAGNEVSSSDTANLLLMLQLLRQSLPNAILSTCTTQRAYIGANGSPVADVSSFANVLDHILVMNYDVWGASSTPGPNAPLRNDCPNSLQPDANMQSAINAWTNAGMPASKILMGVPAYGYVSSSSATTLIHKRDSIPSTGLANRGLANLRHEERYMSEGHKWYLDGMTKMKARQRARRAAKRQERKRQTEALAATGSVIICPGNHSGKPCPGVTGQNISEIDWNPLAGSGGGSGPTTGPDGVFVPGTGPGKVGTGNVSGLAGNQIQFVDMINYGVIVKSSTTLEFVGTNGYTRAWDDCSSTPYLYDTSRKVVITYDDPGSLALKGELAVQNGIAGIGMWDISGDTADFQLTRAWRAGLGLSA